MKLNRRTWTTMLVLLLVPLFAAGGMLWGTSRLDTNLRGVQAAVVNNDEMVTINGKLMPLGRQLAAELVDTDREQNFTWVLASAEKAQEGLASGRYAAVVTIPKEFSAAASSFSKPANEAVKATIHVETSPVAGISETALGQSIADAATNALNRFLTGEYLKNIYLGFNQMHAQMLELVSGTRKLADGADQLAAGASKSANGAGKLADGLGQAAAGSPKLRSGASAAASGGAQLATGSKALASGARQLSTGAQQLSQGADTYADGVQQYSAGVSTYTQSILKLIRPVRDVVAQLPEWAGWVEKIKKVVVDLTDQAIKLDAQIQGVIAKLRDYVKETFGIADDASALARSASTLAGKVSAGTSDLKIACPAKLSATSGGCDAFAAGVAAAGKHSDKTLAASTKTFQADADKLAERAIDNKEAGRKILELLDKLSAASKKMVEWAPKVQQELADLEASIPPGTPKSKAELLALIDKFISGSEQLDAGGQRLAQGGAQLASGARRLSSGAHGLASGTDKLAGGLDGLAGGLGQLSTGVNAYTGGVDTAAAGAAHLAGGLGQLSDGATGLADGTGKLADGVAEGADKIPTYNDAERDQLSGVVASPVDGSGLSALVRPNLAWVSLLLVSALWLGAMATFAMTGRADKRAALSTAATGRLFGREFGPGLGIIAGQGVLLAGLGWVALRLTVVEGLLLCAALLVSAAAFALLNFALARLLGNGGRLLCFALLLICIVTASTSTAPGFFTAVRGLSPVSGALDAVRDVSTTGNVVIPMFVLLGWGILGAVAAVTAVARTRMVPLSSVVNAPA